MRFDRDMDSPLHFEDTPTPTEPYRIRNAIIVDGEVTTAINSLTDSVSAFASHARLEKQRFGTPKHGERASRYARAGLKELHHQHEYCPCRTLSPEEYEECKCDI